MCVYSASFPPYSVISLFCRLFSPFLIPPDFHHTTYCTTPRKNSSVTSYSEGGNERRGKKKMKERVRRARFWDLIFIDRYETSRPGVRRVALCCVAGLLILLSSSFFSHVCTVRYVPMIRGIGTERKKRNPSERARDQVCVIVMRESSRVDVVISSTVLSD